ncbi:MAG: hydrogenase formation protein HypD [Candidatus Aminicenantes bacterium]|nr:hydrogenase formation protein HypD [Candidatus Aminicenantes bacterium]
MKEFRDRKVIAGLLRTIGRQASQAGPPVRLMEVCGTHTMAIHRYGLHALLHEAGVEMTSGPGCPVCITPDAHHRAAIGLVTRRENLILATFGDITRVPTRDGSLQTAIPAPRSRVRVVYSAQDALETARENPDRDVVFFGAGFETTIPSIALAVKQAAEEAVENFSLLSALWLIPPPLRALLESEEVRIQGFLYPGHVSAVIGCRPYEFVAEEFGLPGAVAGFEPADILLAASAVLNQMIRRSPAVENTYKRVVRTDGNPRALILMDEVLETTDAVWRGLGLIPRSGLKLRSRFSAFDALKKYGLNIAPAADELPGCRCGEVLRGVIKPTDCGLFGGACRPESPRGPCMVSPEGACLVYYRFAKS